MGYGKSDVQEALEAEEPSAIKDAYMIVRENKLMENNRKFSHSCSISIFLPHGYVSRLRCVLAPRAVATNLTYSKQTSEPTIPLASLQQTDSMLN